MIGRTLGGATVATLQGIIVLFISMLAGFRPVNWAATPLAVLAMVLTALLFCALGTAIASMLADMQGFQLIMNFLVMPLFFLSGALFPLQGSGAMATIARFNPLSYGVDALRGLLVNIYHFGLAVDFCKIVDGKASWEGDWSFLAPLCAANGMIWGGDWGAPDKQHSFRDYDHVQRCEVIQQAELFAGTWYPEAAEPGPGGSPDASQDGTVTA
jgi:hypothetical protein